MNELGQHSYTIAFSYQKGDVKIEHPVRVIADTPNGMLVEADDIWKLVDGPFLWTSNPIKDDRSAERLYDALRKQYLAVVGLEVRQTTRVGTHACLAQIHLTLKKKDIIHRMYFNWGSSLLNKLPVEHEIHFSDVVALIGRTYPYEFNWEDEAEYQGKHNTLPITIFARGAQMGICKVHVDLPNWPQKVFRGSADRFIDMIEQAKAYIRGNA